jgi:hypothetical protein
MVHCSDDDGVGGWDEKVGFGLERIKGFGLTEFPNCARGDGHPFYT